MCMRQVFACLDTMGIQNSTGTFLVTESQAFLMCISSYTVVFPIYSNLFLNYLTHSVYLTSRNSHRRPQYFVSYKYRVQKKNT
jgi:hypothetical protein